MATNSSHCCDIIDEKKMTTDRFNNNHRDRHGRRNYHHHGRHDLGAIWRIIFSVIIIFLFTNKILIVTARRSVASNFSISPPNRARIQYKTTYACEHRELQLRCEPGESIHLVRANYGRFSLSICNDGGRPDLSVMCMSYRSFLIMTDRCSNKSNCSVVVSSKLFGDPCPGTPKYLEVQYHCVQGAASSGSASVSSSSSSTGQSSSSTKKPAPPPPPPTMVDGNNGSNVAVPVPVVSSPPVVSPPIPTPSLPPASIDVPVVVVPNENDSLPNLRRIPLANRTIESPQPPPPQSPISDTLPLTIQPFINNNVPSESESGTESSPVSPGPRSDQQPQQPISLPPPMYMDPVEDFCPSLFVRSLFWNSIRKDEMTVQKCPGGATGMVRWRCNYNPELGIAEWYPLRPDFSECRSLWLDNLEERLNNREPVIKIASELALMTLTKPLYSEDLVKIARIIREFLEHAISSIQTLQTVDVWHRHQVLKELLNFIVETISNLLGNGQDDAWLDLNIVNRKEVASSLIKSLENSALLLAENTNEDGSTAIAKPNVLVSVHVLETKMPISLQFPTYDDTSGTNEWTRMEDSIFLPAQPLVDHSQGGLAKVSFFAYYRIEDLLKPSPHTEFSNAAGGGFGGLPHHHHHHLHYSQQNHSSLSINSRVIGAALSHGDDGDQMVRLSQPVTIVLRHIQEENISRPQCVYWNIEHQNWLTDGCWVEATNVTHTVCMCNHLTHFALLSEIKSYPDGPGSPYGNHRRAITGPARTLVLASCALTLLILAFVTVLVFMTPVGNIISASNHRNLYFTLLASQLVYVCVIFSADTIGSAAATILATSLALLHYFLLASFFWTFFQSFDIYMNVNLIYEHFRSSRRLWWYYTFAYLAPLAIVIVCYIPAPSYYTEFLLWPANSSYVYLTFIGPFIGLILASVIFLLFSYVIIRNHTVSATTIKCFEDIRLGGSRALIGWIVMLTIFQSLTWSLAFAYLFGPDSLMIAVAFALANLALGTFVALFAILKTENIQHSRLFRHLPLSAIFTNRSHHLGPGSTGSGAASAGTVSGKNSTTSDVYSTRPVVTQVTTQVNGMIGQHHQVLATTATGHHHLHHPHPHHQHSSQTSSPTSPISMSPGHSGSGTMLPGMNQHQQQPLPISHSTQWSRSDGGQLQITGNSHLFPKNSSCIKRDPQSILAQQELNSLLYNYHGDTDKSAASSSSSSMMTMVQQHNNQPNEQPIIEFNSKMAADSFLLRRSSKSSKSNNQQHHHHHHTLMAPNRRPQQQQYFISNNHPIIGIDHIYESIDTDSLASMTMNEYNRRLMMVAAGTGIYGQQQNRNSKSTVNEDDLSTSSIYEDKPLLFTGSGSIANQYQSSNDNGNTTGTKARRSKQQQPDQHHGHTNMLWHWNRSGTGIDPGVSLPDLLQKSNMLTSAGGGPPTPPTNQMLVSYSDENKIRNKVILNSGANTSATTAGNNGAK